MGDLASLIDFLSEPEMNAPDAVIERASRMNPTERREARARADREAVEMAEESERQARIRNRERVRREGEDMVREFEDRPTVGASTYALQPLVGPAASWALRSFLEEESERQARIRNRERVRREGEDMVREFEDRPTVGASSFSELPVAGDLMRASTYALQPLVGNAPSGALRSFLETPLDPRAVAHGAMESLPGGAPLLESLVTGRPLDEVRGTYRQAVAGNPEGSYLGAVLAGIPQMLIAGPAGPGILRGLARAAVNTGLAAHARGMGETNLSDDPSLEGYGQRVLGAAPMAAAFSMGGEALPAVASRVLGTGASLADRAAHAGARALGFSPGSARELASSIPRPDVETAATRAGGGVGYVVDRAKAELARHGLDIGSMLDAPDQAANALSRDFSGVAKSVEELLGRQPGGVSTEDFLSRMGEQAQDLRRAGSVPEIWRADAIARLLRETIEASKPRPAMTEAQALEEALDGGFERAPRPDMTFPQAHLNRQALQDTVRTWGDAGQDYVTKAARDASRTLSEMTREALPEADRVAYREAQRRMATLGPENAQTGLVSSIRRIASDVGDGPNPMDIAAGAHNPASGGLRILSRLGLTEPRMASAAHSMLSSPITQGAAGAAEMARTTHGFGLTAGGYGVPSFAPGGQPSQAPETTPSPLQTVGSGGGRPLTLEDFDEDTDFGAAPPAPPPSPSGMPSGGRPLTLNDF